MNVTRRRTLPSAQVKPLETSGAGADWAAAAAEWPSLPTETELYILPNGQIVIADLPIELQSLLTRLGRPISAEIELSPLHD